jgi:hypothetical protein
MTAMLNRAPVFVNGFARGGTNIVTNLLQSHPDLCVAAGETQDVFRGRALTDPAWRVRWNRAAYGLPLRVALRTDIFNPYRRDEPPMPPPPLRRFIDGVLYVEKLLARHPWHNRDRDEGVRYTLDEIRRARLLSKNLDANLWLTPMFARMYPDATFFGLVRNGLALCEGNMRRDFTARGYGAWYRRLAGRLLDDADRLPGYHLLRFEEVLADPLGLTLRCYRLAGLDPSRLGKIRLQVKATTGADGVRRLRAGFGDREVVWCAPAELRAQLVGEIDEHQIRRLSPSDAREFLAEAGPVMARLGYA